MSCIYTDSLLGLRSSDILTALTEIVRSMSVLEFNNSLSLPLVISENSPAVSHHDWIARLNPCVVRFDEGFGIRSYGLASVARFLLAGWIPLKWARKRLLPITEEQVCTFILYSALGVMIGGGLGYCPLYEAHNILDQPLEIFALWHGGMASHCVVAGLIIVLWAFARQRGMIVTPLLDAAAVTVPPGIANFINGELWRRPTSVPSAVIFPQAPLVNGIQVPRHPSQLYAAGIEGFLVFLAVQCIYSRSWRVGMTRAAVCIAFGNWTTIH
jgi:phosphatidylglycerol:prolipoprotein diacylglycerol transferase